MQLCRCSTVLRPQTSWTYSEKAPFLALHKPHQQEAPPVHYFVPHCLFKNVAVTFVPSVSNVRSGAQSGAPGSARRRQQSTSGRMATLRQFLRTHPYQAEASNPNTFSTNLGTVVLCAQHTTHLPKERNVELPKMVQKQRSRNCGKLHKLRCGSSS